MKLILALIAVTSLITALCITKGMVGSVSCKDKYAYGERLNCHADAFLSRVQYEFKEQGGSWSPEQPRLPGQYAVRAVSTDITGKKIYSKVKEFSIVPKKITVTVAENALRYGDEPTLKASLVAKDSIHCDGYGYGNILDAKTEVWAERDRIRILDENGNDVSFAYVIATEKKNVIILPRQISVTVADSSKHYDGMKFSYDQYELSGGTLAEGDILMATFTASLTNVGSTVNQPSLQIMTSDGLDVTHHYSIQEKFGALSVEKRPLVIAVGSTSLTYDGKMHSHSVVAISPETPLVDGHKLEITNALRVKDAGEYNNWMKFSVLDAEGNAVSDNYSMIVEQGTMTIHPKDVTVTTPSGSWVYDGSSHSNHDYRIEGLLEGHTAGIGFASAITNCGSSENRIEVVIRDKNGTIDTDNYRIIYQYGTLEVTKRQVTIRPLGITAIYNGKEVYSHKYSVVSTQTFAKNQFLQIEQSTTVIDADSQLNVFEDFKVVNIYNDVVTDNYDIEQINDQYIVVVKRPIKIAPVYVEEYYCGTQICPTEVSYNKGSYEGLLTDHTIQALIFGASTYITKEPIVTSINSATITDPEGRDVTDNYEIEYHTGLLKVNPRPIMIKIPDTEKIYDNIALSANMVYEVYPVEPLTEAIVKNDSISMISCSGSVINVGSVVGKFTKCTIVNKSTGKDVTENYTITHQSGILKILPRPIMVQSGSASKVYDGTALTCTDPIVIVSGSLVNGHVLSMMAVGSIIEVGKIPNDIVGSIYNRSLTVDVGKNYEITEASGTLTVYGSDYNTDGSGDSGNEGGSGGANGIDLSGNLANGGSSEENENNTVLRIKSSYTNAIYLRLKSFGDYTGTSWREATQYPLLLNDKYSYNYLPGIALDKAEVPEATLLVQSFTNQYLLPYHLAMNDAGYQVQTSDVRYEGSSVSEYSVPYYVYSGLATDYRGLLGSYMESELAYRQFVYFNYCTVDKNTLAAMEQIIQKEGFDISDPMVYEKVASYIQNVATYNKDYDKAMDGESNIVLAFLNKYKEGVCIHYASAATLLFRSLGIPARYVVGFVGNTVADQWTEIQTPGHAWTEVYIDGIGWMPIEVTGGSGENGGEGGSGGSSSGGTPDDRPVLQITPVYRSKVYDGTPLMAVNELEVYDELVRLIEEGYTYTVDIEGQRTDVGKGVSSITSFKLFDPDGNDVTDKYYVMRQKGTLEVFVSDANIVKVYLHRLQKYYDGTPLSYGDNDYTIVEIPKDTELKLTLNISMTDVGYLTLSDINRNLHHYADYQITRNGEDITMNSKVVFVSIYDANEQYVPIRVDKRAIELTAISASKVYDGEPLVSSGATITKGSLAPGCHLDNVTVLGRILDVGSTGCYVVDGFVIIKNKQGINVTSNYAITTRSGKLTVIESKNT